MSIIDELAEVIEYETCNRAMAERIAKAVVVLLASKAGDVRGMLAPVGQGGELEDMRIEWDVLHYVLDLCAERIAPIVGALREEGQTFRIRACMPEPDEPVEHVAVTKNGVTTLLREVEAPVPVAPFDPKDYCGVKVPDSDEPVADPAERAKAVAKILRGRGMWVRYYGWGGVHVLCYDAPAEGDWNEHHYRTDQIAAWATIGPRAIADVIQAEEARRAQKWAGDE